MNQVTSKTINCTNCGATLCILGGSQVSSHTCAACGAILDVHHNYAINAQHSVMPAKRPPLPLQIGMIGQLEGVECTIIGVVEYCYGRNTKDEERWLSYQIYSPKQGYAWLAWEYDSPSRYQLSRQTSWSPDYEHIKDSYTAEITYIAGELTWLPDLGDIIEEGDTYTSNVSFERADGETEYYTNHYLNAQNVKQAFKLPTPAADTTEAKPASESASTPAGDDKQPTEKTKKKGGSGCLIATIFMIFIVFLLSMCSSGDKNKNTSATQPNTSSTTTTENDSERNEFTASSQPTYSGSNYSHNYDDNRYLDDRRDDDEQELDIDINLKPGTSRNQLQTAPQGTANTIGAFAGGAIAGQALNNAANANTTAINRQNNAAINTTNDRQNNSSASTPSRSSSSSSSSGSSSNLRAKGSGIGSSSGFGK